MSSYEDQCVKVGVVFHALYFENEVSDPPIFCISDIGNSLSDCRQTMTKICAVEVFCANVLNSQPNDFSNSAIIKRHPFWMDRPHISHVRNYSKTVNG